MNKNKIFLVLCLLGLAVVARLLPHLPNFAPITAIALIAGLYLGKKWSVILPIVGLLLSDIFVGFYDWRLMAVVYGSFMSIGIFSWWLKKNPGFLKLALTSIWSSIFFFLTTNFAVWAFSAWYPKTLAGLLNCFALALPFLRNSFLGDLFYVSVFYFSIVLVKIFVKKYQLVKQNISL
jgi:hypothetical protein